MPLYEGADGNTASQLESVFGFSKDDSHRWTSYYDLTKSFNDNSEDYYYLVSDTISDPQLGAKRINADPNLRMILTNAVYFKGLWEEREIINTFVSIKDGRFGSARVWCKMNIHGNVQV